MCRDDQGNIPIPPFVPSQPPPLPQQQQASSEIQVVLAISSAEAAGGTTRTLTLPDGRQVIVRVPAGVYDGQRISVQESGGPPMTLTLALAVMQTNVPGVPYNTERTMRSSNPDIVPPNNAAITPLLGQTPIPPPPLGFQQSWMPVPNPPSWTPVQNLETHAPTVQASNPNLQQ
jgi:hypothetical protein